MSKEEEKNQNIKDIKTDVGEIRKSFGTKIKVNMPNGEPNKEEEKLDLMELVLYGMSSGLFVKPEKTETGWISLFNSNKKSYLYLIHNEIKTLNKNLSKILGKGNKFDDVSKSLKNSSNNIGDTLKGLSKILSKSDIKDNLKSIIESIQTIFESNIDSDKISDATSAIKDLMDILTYDGKPNIKYVKALYLQLSREGYITKIINSLYDIYKERGEINMSFAYIDDLLKSIFAIGEYDLKQLIKFDLKSKYFSYLVNTNIKEGIIEKILELSDKYDLSKSLEGIVELFENIDMLITTIDSIDIDITKIEKANSIEEFFKTLNNMELLDKTKFDNFKSILFDDIKNINENNIVKYINDNLDQLILSAIKLTELKTKLPTDIDKEITYTNLSKTLENFVETFNPYSDNAFTRSELSFSIFINVLDSIGDLNNKFVDLSKNVENIDLSKLTEFIQSEDLKNFLNEFATIGNNQTLIKYLNDVNITQEDINKISLINNLLVELSKLSKFAKLSLWLKLIKVKPYRKLIDIVTYLITSFNKIEDDDIEKAKKSVEAAVILLDSISAFVIKSAAILLIGGLAMKVIDIGDIVGFGFVLTFFVGAMATIALAISSIFDKENIKIEALDSFRDFVTELSKILVIGSLLMALISWPNILSFIVWTGIFIAEMAVIAYQINKRFGEDKKIFDSLDKFKSYMVTCAGVMLFGSLIMKIIKLSDIFFFTTSLAIFITLVSLPFLIFDHIKGDVFKNAKDFSLLVTVSAGIMIIGAMFAKDFEFIKNALIFGVSLAGFIWLISLPFIWLSKKNMGMIMGTALSMSLLTIVCGGLLLTAGYLISKHPNILFGAITFAFGLALFIGIMGGIIYLLGQVATKATVYILAGLAFIGGIMLLTFASVALIEYIHDKQTENKLDIRAAITTIFGNFKTLIKEIIDLVNYIFDFGDGKGKWNWSSGFGSILKGVLGGIGQMGLLSMGIMIVYILSLTMIIATGSMAIVARALDGINIGLINTKITELFDVYKTILNTYKEEFEFEDIYNAWKVSRVLSELSGAIGKSAEALGLMAQLKFATGYDSKGNPTGYITITSTDFSQVTTNIESILTVLGNAIKNTAKNNTDIFGDWGLFKDSPAMNAAKVIGVIGRSLIPVAQGIKEWVNLKIPTKFDAKGNPTEYKTINDSDLTTASVNINKVLTCLGKAIITTVKDNKDIFADGVLTNSPAMNAAKAIGVMGDTLKNIAFAVSEFASGTFYTFDENGKPIGNPITIDDTTYKQLLGDGTDKNKGTIELLLTSLGNAIVNTVKNSKNKELFHEGTFTKAPAMIAANSIKAMADSLMTVVDVIKKLNEDPQFSKETIETTMEDVKKKITAIISCIVDSNKSIFDTINGMELGQNPGNKSTNVSRSGVFGVIADFFAGRKTMTEYVGESMEEMTDTLGNLAENINSILTITGILTQFSEKLKDKDGNEIDFNSKLEKLAGENGIKKSIEYINSIKKSIISGIATKTFIKGSNTTVDSKEYYKFIEDTVGALESCIKSIIKLSEISGGKKNNLGLAAIPGTVGQLLDKLTNKTEELNSFSKLVSDTKEFVQHINALDLHKMNTMQSLIKSIAELSDKMGSLDKFTEALSTEIINVLSELVLQLRKAEATITSAHELQNKRKQLIKDSVKEIKNIMGQHMVVEIYKNDQNGEISLDGGKNFVKDTATSGGSKNDSKPSPLVSETSPEDTSLAPTKNDNKSSWGGHDDEYLLNQIKNMFKRVPGYNEK